MFLRFLESLKLSVIIVVVVFGCLALIGIIGALVAWIVGKRKENQQGAEIYEDEPSSKGQRNALITSESEGDFGDDDKTAAATEEKSSSTPTPQNFTEAETEKPWGLLSDMPLTTSESFKRAESSSSDSFDKPLEHEPPAKEPVPSKRAFSEKSFPIPILPKKTPPV